MSSRQLFMCLPLAAVVLASITWWEMQTREGGLPDFTRNERLSLKPVGKALQFELYDLDNNTVRLSRYLGRHKIILAFVPRGSKLDTVVTQCRVGWGEHDAESGESCIVVLVSPELPQSLRHQVGPMRNAAVVYLSDAGGRRGQVPGEAATAWGVGRGVTSATELTVFHIDRAGRVRWKNGRPAGSNKSPTDMAGQGSGP